MQYQINQKPVTNKELQIIIGVFNWVHVWAIVLRLEGFVSQNLGVIK